MRNPVAQGRPDANHAEIVKRYEQQYCNVIDLSKVGFGCPDILIALGRRCFLREIKTEDGELEPSQIRFASVWRGPKIEVIRTLDEVDLDVRRASRGGP